MIFFKKLPDFFLEKNLTVFPLVRFASRSQSDGFVMRCYIRAKAVTVYQAAEIFFFRPTKNKWREGGGRDA